MTESPALVVGIGASAGGIEALRVLLGALPAGTQLCFIIVMPVDPGANDLFSEVISKFSHLPVLEVENGIHIKPVHIYVVLGHHTIAMKAGVLT
jgi:two-component system CheB/CheR fusion protein